MSQPSRVYPKSAGFNIRKYMDDFTALKKSREILQEKEDPASGCMKKCSVHITKHQGNAKKKKKRDIAKLRLLSERLEMAGVVRM